MTPQRPAGAGTPLTPDQGPPTAAARTSAKAPRQPGPAQLYAALDLGTNSCRMLIARPKGGQFEVVDSFSKAVELGHGAGKLRPVVARPMQRTLAGPAHLPVEAGTARRAQDAAGRDRSLPPRAQQPRFHSPRAARNRAEAGHHHRRGRGAAGGRVLCVAGGAGYRAACWSSTLVAGRPNWSGSTCRGLPRRAAQRDPVHVQGRLQPRHRCRANRKWSTGSACPWAWRR